MAGGSGGGGDGEAGLDDTPGLRTLRPRTGPPMAPIPALGDGRLATMAVLLLTIGGAELGLEGDGSRAVDRTLSVVFDRVREARGSSSGSEQKISGGFR